MAIYLIFYTQRTGRAKAEVELWIIVIKSHTHRPDAFQIAVEIQIQTESKNVEAEYSLEFSVRTLVIKSLLALLGSYYYTVTDLGYVISR